MAEEAKKEAAEGAEKGAPAAAPKKKLGRMLPFLIGGVVSGGLGATAAIVTAPPEKHEKENVEKPTTATTPLDKFPVKKEIALPVIITNLADTVSGKFSIHLEVRTKTPELFETLKASCAKDAEHSHYAAICDVLGGLISTKSSSELKTMAGREVLKLEIIDRLKPVLFADAESGVLTDVLFESFLLQ